MKKIIISLLLLSFILGCKRNESNSSQAASAESLTQIAVYPTSIPEPSGLAYNSKNNTLMTVSDHNSTIYEIDTTGNILNTITISGTDLEGITLSQNCDTFYVAEEANQLVTKYLSDGTEISSFSVNVAENTKHSLEGITRDNNNYLFVINEKNPCMLLEFNDNKELFRKELTYTTDISDIFYEEKEDCLWIVSDESEKVLKLSKTGTLLAEYSIPFAKGEGISIINDKIYIINDSTGNLYVFKKP
jgi:uncharacterized protein YjiK